MLLERIRTTEFKLGDILSAGWTIFTSRFGTILAILLIVYIPINIVLSLVTPPEEAGLEEIRQSFQLGQFLYLWFGILATMAVAFVVERSLAGENIGFRQALRKAVSRWGSMIWANIIAGIIVLGLTLLLIVPGIIWIVYYTFVEYAVVLRGKGGKTALDYSKSLVKGNWWKVCGISILFAILSFLTYIIVDIPFWFLPQNVLTIVVSTTLGDIVSTLFLVAMAIFFLNLDYLKNPETTESGAED